MEVRRDGQTLDMWAIVEIIILVQLWPVTAGSLILGQPRRKRQIFMKGRDEVLMVLLIETLYTKKRECYTGWQIGYKNYHGLKC